MLYKKQANPTIVSSDYYNRVVKQLIEQKETTPKILKLLNMMDTFLI